MLKCTQVFPVTSHLTGTKEISIHFLVKKNSALSGKWFLLIDNCIGGYVHKRLRGRGDSSLFQILALEEKYCIWKIGLTDCS